METKYRSVNETKAQICELLTSRREQTFSQEWIRNEEGCYFISTFKYYYKEAKEYCLNTDSKLLEINSAEEEESGFESRVQDVR
ncbi:oxidized low-density lipoprotein receptor 1-like [Hypanus sabinus]|uniref:oxidized low-density lipoprotein receptor 1-like n=1 Tax=Hypanus sabinus TaxID=79690 RepID=UPI0028C50494|nr:oxidized low-density lipoprotein receptor 1-like [Hypanus sabinus]XP_059814811.1 oxidized low-density lipoprotein receptor 1-like [Hypanus sabinus]XP_059816684.1 oxidized low-density lipoprotein receptor 1-like [Hypanus sabinus]